MERDAPTDIADLVIIGAGPHALALVTKLLEPHRDPLEETPDNESVFRTVRGDDATRIRAKWDGDPPPRINMLDRDMREIIKTSALCADRHVLALSKVVVVDSQPWLGQWRDQFKALGITQLRSSYFAHPCPVDVQSLRLYAEDKKLREKEIIPIDLPGSSAYHGPYAVPSTGIFSEFCQDLIERYHLQEKILAGRVQSIQRVSSPVHNKDTTLPSCSPDHPREKLLEIVLEDGRHVVAKNVVVAAGSQNRPHYPEWMTELSQKDRYVHATDLLKGRADVSYIHENPNCRVLIVGGGLTAGHLAAMALNAELQNITMCARRNVDVRQFDLDIRWMGLHRNTELAAFWSKASLAERREILKEAKPGGSVTPEIMEVVQRGIDEGRLSLLENVEIRTVKWTGDEWSVVGDGMPLKTFDYIWFGTGTVVDVSSDPLLDSLWEDCPIQTFDGLPALTKELRWSDDVNLFMMGDYAGLQLGPGAVNLMGARAGAARIVNALQRSGYEYLGGQYRYARGKKIEKPKRGAEVNGRM